ncbi:trimethylamine N-oxide reductase system, TorE protein [Shewanella woodyi ATCC 51908]|uniref:Trimethylamine N-oxide reductase system, TorE protein n=2 Tax=Shewanella TaxID=22 RepID=B1KRM3_SHEWM|nr:trimethylamine N-oxide reductase system, TorE protein [Shewanella woodyi ATCC 51908]
MLYISVIEDKITLRESVMADHLPTETPAEVKSKELKALGFIIVLLFPILTISGIGAYGLIIWIIQAFAGVASH